jgi:hypothetical protein
MKTIESKQKARRMTPLKSKTTVWNTQRRYVVRFR